jgi:quinol monooxygenase YgiN
MSLLVRYTLKSADDHDAQTKAMAELVASLKTAGIAGLNYSCFATEEPTEFIGVLEFDGEDAFAAFQASAAFETYKAKVGPTFANPPQTTGLKPIANTRS